MAPTKSGGRVSIRVFPDTSRFRRTLKRELDQIERSTEVKIKVTPEVDRRSIVKMKRQIEAYLEDTTFQIKAEVEVSRASLVKAKAEIEAIRANLNVDVHTATARASLALLTRTRSVEIMPFINSIGLANVSRRLAGLGGLGVLTDTIRDARSFLDNIDRHAVTMGRFATNMMNLISVIGATAAQSLVLASDLGSMVGILTLLPAFGIGAAIGIGSLVAVFKDMSTVLADLGPMMGELQDVMSARFWDEAAGPIRELVNSLFPTLRREMAELAEVQGRFLGDIAKSVQANVTPEVFTVMMDRLTAATDRARGAIDPLMRAITTLGLHGSKYFDRMAESIVTMSEEFDRFIANADANGDLERWTETAIQAFKDLTGTAIGAVRVIGELGSIAEAAGFGGLSDLNTGLNAAADAMSREEFRTPLITYFEGFRDGVAEIAAGLYELGEGLSSFAPTFAEAERSAGRILRTILGYVSDLISNPIFQGGVNDLFSGLEDGVNNLAPGMDQLEISLGQVLTLMGSVARELGNLASTFLTEFGPALDVVGAQLESLVTPLSEAIQEIITNLAPPLEYFANEVMPGLTTAFRDEFLPALTELSDFVGEGLQPVLEEVDQFVRQDLTEALKGIKTSLEDADPEEFGESVRTFFTDVETWLNKISGTTGGEGGMLGDWLGLQSGSHREGMDNFLTDLETFNQGFADWARGFTETVIIPAWDEIIRTHNQKMDEFQADPEPPGMWLLDWVTALFRPNGQPVEEAIAEDWEELKTAFQTGFTSIGEAIATFWQESNAAWAQDWANFGAGISGMGEDFRIWVEGMLQPMRDYWDRFFDDLFGTNGNANLKMANFPAMAGMAIAPLATVILQHLPAILTGWDTAWTTMGTTLQTRFTGFGLTVSSGMLSLAGTVQTNAAAIQTSWDLGWSIMGTTLQTRFTGYALTVTGGMLSLAGSVSSNAITIQSTWSSAWTVMDGVLRQKFMSYAVTASSGMIQMAGSIAGQMATIQGTWSTAWSLVQGITTTRWATIQSAVQIGVQIVGQTVSTMGPVVQGHATTAWSLVQSATSLGWQIVTSSVSQGVMNAAAEAGRLGPAAVAAVGNLGGMLVGAGSSLVQGFIDGINGMMGALEGAAVNVAATISKYMPRSPAKMGPLSGKGYTSWSGKALVRDLAAGMESNMGLVKAAADAVANQANVDPNALKSPNSAFAETMEQYGGDHFRFEGPVFGSIPELVETVKKTRRRELVVQRVKRLQVG